MRWNALTTAASLLLIVSVSGCGLFTKKKTTVQTTDASTDMYASSTYGEPMAESDPYQPYTPPATEERSYPTTGGAQESWAGQYHTVAKKDTLYRLARMYYNDEARWKDIYDANRTEISNPDNIYVGQRLLIP